MLTNWPPPQTSVTITRQIGTYPEGTKGVLMSYITQKSAFEFRSDEFVIKIGEEEIKVTRADITTAL